MTSDGLTLNIKLGGVTIEYGEGGAVTSDGLRTRPLFPGELQDMLEGEREMGGGGGIKRRREGSEDMLRDESGEGTRRQRRRDDDEVDVEAEGGRRGVDEGADWEGKRIEEDDDGGEGAGERRAGGGGEFEKVKELKDSIKMANEEGDKHLARALTRQLKTMLSLSPKFR